MDGLLARSCKSTNLIPVKSNPAASLAARIARRHARPCGRGISGPAESWPSSPEIDGERWTVTPDVEDPVALPEPPAAEPAYVPSEADERWAAAEFLREEVLLAGLEETFERGLDDGHHDEHEAPALVEIGLSPNGHSYPIFGDSIELP